MKYIIKETQLNLNNSEDLERKADILHKLFITFYPENYEWDTETDSMSSDIEIYDDESKSNLLFYYRWDTQEFYIGANFIHNLYKKTNLPFLDYAEVKTNKREMFEKIIKIFSKKYFGWYVKKVFFHFY